MSLTRSLNDTLHDPISDSLSMAHRILNWVRPVAERLLLIRRIRNACQALPPARIGGTIEERMLELLQVSIRIQEKDLEAVPRSGPLVVVSNHPFGAVDGLVLATVLHSIRPDFKIMVNHLLRYLPVPELQNHLIYVNPYGHRNAVRANIKAVRQAVQWVQKGSTLMIFPAGEVSHLQCGKRTITDPPWNETVARIVRMTDASVLPVYFEGANSAIFQLLGLIHPRVRTLLLPREVLKMRHQAVTMRVGRPIGNDKLRRFDSDFRMTQYLRLKTYILRTQTGVEPVPAEGGESPAPPVQRSAIALKVTAHGLSPELENLSPRQVLVDTPRFTVYEASSAEIPNLLQQIGRLREITFRAAGEGTGKEVDLDRFDGHYRHLVLWSKEESEVAGGYRLGLTGEIREGLGPRGFYTSTLFDYGREFVDRIHPAIELGRSFVVPKYQKSYQPLMLLWRGIGELIASRPEYATLFGPVSINSGYHSLSRELMVAFCQSKRLSPLAGLVRPKHPLRSKKRKAKEMDAACRLLEDMQDLSELVSDIEADQKGIPILLKQYMKLGGEVLGFSTDPHFSNVLDALILVDLRRTDVKILDRYMGKPNASAFSRFHLDQGLAWAGCA
ncbi:MAG: lysophospholipid acyltransferase family protein [Syntrophobacteraceae bacterium]